MSLRGGDRIIDMDGDIGTVVDATDPHNINVILDEPHGGCGIYCTVEGCKDYELLEIAL